MFPRRFRSEKRGVFREPLFFTDEGVFSNHFLGQRFVLY